VNRSLRTLAFAAIVALGAASAVTAAPEPVRIDALLAQTGGASFLGTEEAATLKLVAAYVNAHGGVRGRPVEFVVSDEQSNPQAAVSLMGQIVARHPSAVIGTGFTATCKAISPLVQENGPVLYCITPGVQPQAGGFVFSANISTHDLAPVTLRFFREKGWHKVALISSTDATGQDFEAGFNEALGHSEFKSLELVAREHFNTTDLSVAAQMARIKSSGAQAVVLWATGTGFGTLLRGYHDAGLEIPAAGGNGNLIYPQLQQYAAFIPAQLYFAAPRAIAEGGVGAGPVRDAQAPYFAALKKAGMRSDIPTTMAWDPAMIIIDALRALGPNASPAQIRAYIEGLHSWAGILGIYDFRDRSQRGLGENNAVMLRYDGPTNAVTTVSRPAGRLK
jgi:branched-chain amino acid transport system substrate-binding protein